MSKVDLHLHTNLSDGLISPEDVVIKAKNNDCKIISITDHELLNEYDALAKKYNITVDDLAGLNGLNKEDYIYPNQEIVVPTGKAKIYITKNGDTVDTLSKKFNTDYGNVLNQNKKLYLLPDQLIIYEEENL